MSKSALFTDPKLFSASLFERMKLINPGIAEMELYEFIYTLNNITPADGWAAVSIRSQGEFDALVNDRKFYDSIKIKEKIDGKIILDPHITDLTQQLLVGIVNGDYSLDWIRQNFYFDIRGFFFLHRTEYFTEKVTKHLGGKPYLAFEKKQKHFDTIQDIGYKAFKSSNAEVDKSFIETTLQLIPRMGTPLLIAIAGPTAAGKTEIVERLSEEFEKVGKKVTSIELDNFLTDRDYREEKGIFTQGKEALHFALFKTSLIDISHGKKITIPRYDFIDATSSHDLEGHLKPGGIPIEINPADIIFIEGNFPFLLDEISPLIGLKVVYLTDDHIRFKRKWKRDIDYRKKYESKYFCNRFFKDQFIMAEIAYRPQMEVCDIVVDTTEASLWITPKVKYLLQLEKQS
jgi:uridine kinase